MPDWNQRSKPLTVSGFTSEREGTILDGSPAFRTPHSRFPESGAQDLVTSEGRRILPDPLARKQLRGQNRPRSCAGTERA